MSAIEDFSSFFDRAVPFHFMTWLEFVFSDSCSSLSNLAFVPVHLGAPQGLLAVLTVPLAVVHLHVLLHPLRHRRPHVQDLETRKTSKSKFGLSLSLFVINIVGDSMCCRHKCSGKKICKGSQFLNLILWYHWGSVYFITQASRVKYSWSVILKASLFYLTVQKYKASRHSHSIYIFWIMKNLYFFFLFNITRQ